MIQQCLALLLQSYKNHFVKTSCRLFLRAEYLTAMKCWLTTLQFLAFYQYLPSSTVTHSRAKPWLCADCLSREAQKNQIIVSSTVVSRRIILSTRASGRQIKAPYILAHLVHPATSFSRYPALFKYLSAHVLILSVSWLFMLWHSRKESEPRCLPSKWEHPVALSSS